jgi:hypothetical protein
MVISLHFIYDFELSKVKTEALSSSSITCYVCIYHETTLTPSKIFEIPSWLPGLICAHGIRAYAVLLYKKGGTQAVCRQD